VHILRDKIIRSFGVNPSRPIDSPADSIGRQVWPQKPRLRTNAAKILSHIVVKTDEWIGKNP